MNIFEHKLHTLDACPDWVRTHPDFEPLREIRDCYARHAPKVRDEKPPVLAGDDILVARLLTCLVSHWEKLGQERSHVEVVAQLEAGKGSDGGDLGGRPLFDLVLCAALCDLQKKAGDYYGANVLPKILSTARYAQLLYGMQPSDDWQGDFYCYLIETGRENLRPLDRFRGLAGLVPWLRKRLVYFIGNRFRKESRYKDKVGDEARLGVNPDEPSPLEGFRDNKGTPLENAALRELTVLIRDCMTEALAKLTPNERLRLGFCYGDERQNQWVARFFGEENYRTTRERQRAEKRFIAFFGEQWESKKSLHAAIIDVLPPLREEAIGILVEILHAETKGANHEHEQ